jgi:asparagine synthase (glutamine-hydrolysing)
MSGLCGWFAQEPSGITLERMAAPIARFERTPLKSAFHARGAVALSGSIDCTSLLQEEGLIVALWGSPGQHAHTLAQRWRSHGAWAGAALSGQFAFVILDAQRGEALVAVDRFATRPLFYQQSGASLLFASSQDALLRHPLGGRDPSAQALYQYLVLGAMPASAWEGQHQLGPGECVHLRAGKLVRHTWWRMRFDEGAAQRGAGLGAAVQAAAAAHGPATAAMNGQMHGQQPGVMLSGGASAILAAQLQAQREPGAEPVPTFSVSYANGAAPQQHQQHVGQQAARVLGTTHYHHTVSPVDLIDAIPRLAALADRPCGNADALVHYHCALLARAQGTLRLLSGAGLAELLGAGALATRQARMTRYAALPAILRQLVIEPAQARLFPRQTHRAWHDLPERIIHASRFGAPATPSLLADAFRDQIDLDVPLDLLRRWWWGAQCRSSTNRAIALDLRVALPAKLAASQLGCFLAGVDVACPFLDDAVADCAAHADVRHKQPGRFGLHARTLRHLAPAVPVRPARADGLPFTAWLQADPDVRALAFDSLADLRRRAIVADAVIDGLLDTPVTAPPPHFGALVWQLMMLEQWFVHRASHRLLGGAVSPAGATELNVAPPGSPHAPICRVDDPHPVGLSG